MPKTSRTKKGLEPNGPNLPTPSDKRTVVSFLFFHSHRKAVGVREELGFSSVSATEV